MSDYDTKGWFSINRKLLKSNLWLSCYFTRGQAWIDLIGLANYKKSSFFIRNIEIKVKRGQLAYSELTLSRRWKWSRTKTTNFLKYLENEHQIKQQRTNLTTVITILNYDEYQKQDTKEDTKKTPKPEIKTHTNNRNKDNNILYISDELKKIYPPSLLKDFELYWTESDSNGKERWKKEKTWDINKRLERWKRTQDKWQHEKNNRFQKVEDKETVRKPNIAGEPTPISNIIKQKDE